VLPTIWSRCNKRKQDADLPSRSLYTDIDGCETRSEKTEGRINFTTAPWSASNAHAVLSVAPFTSAQLVRNEDGADHRLPPPLPRQSRPVSAHQ
jgi:hypothetical protein